MSHNRHVVDFVVDFVVKYVLIFMKIIIMSLSCICLQNMLSWNIILETEWKARSD